MRVKDKDDDNDGHENDGHPVLQECRYAGMVVLQTTVARNRGPRTYNTRNVGPTRPLLLSNVGPGRTYKTENDRTTITAYPGIVVRWDHCKVDLHSRNTCITTITLPAQSRYKTNVGHRLNNLPLSRDLEWHISITCRDIC